MEFVRGVKKIERLNPKIEDVFGAPLFKPTRVIDIILDESHPDYQLFGTPSALGIIRHSPLDQESIRSVTFARPLFPHFKSYPIKNEIVFLIDAPTSEFVEAKEIATYYLPASVAIWNHPHLNALPNKIDTNDDPTRGTKSFTFTDLIRPLKPYEGDVMIEGRFGNSIRLGSSNVSDSRGLNSWSNNKESANQPIVIIRNGQNFSKLEKGNVPINEDINYDASSIYLTSKQQLNITPSSTRIIESYSSARKNPEAFIPPAPTLPSLFNNPQIALTSDRILFNAQQDSLLLFSKKSIGLHTVGPIYIDSGNAVIINSPEIYLGNNATEPVLRGDATGEFLKKMLNLIVDLIDDLIVNFTLVSGAPGEKTGPFSGNYDLLEPILKRIELLKNDIDANVSGIKSTRNYTL